MNVFLLFTGKVISLLFIFFIPGYLSTFFLKRAPGNEKLDRVSLLFFSLLMSILLSSLIALFLAQIGHFSITLLVFPLVLYSLIVVIFLRIKRLKKPELMRKSQWETWCLLAIMLISIVLFFRPHEYLKGGWDPGTYVNTGINIARSGSISTYDKMWASMDSAEQKVFSHTRGGIQQKYPGFIVADPQSGLIIPRFHHLYPVWIAIFYGLFGLKASLYVNSFFALLAIIAFYHAVSVLFNRRVGLLAALLLSVSAIQIWYARFPTSEILAQFLIWSGIYVLTLYEERANPVLGLIGAFALGEAILCSITLVLIIPGIALYFFYRNWSRLKRTDLFFIIAFSFFLLHLILQTLFITKPYVYHIYRYHYFYYRGKAAIILSCAIFSLILLKIFSGRTKPAFKRICKKRWFRGAASFSLVLLAVYGYFLRPGIMASNTNAANLVELALFLTPFGVWIAIFGAALLFWKGFSRKKGLFVIIALSVSLFFLRSKAIHPIYPWALRRYVSVIVPSFYLLASYLIIELSQWRGGLGTGLARYGGKAISALAIIPLLIFPAVRGFPLIKEVDYRGMTEFSSSFAGQMEEDAIYVCDGYWLSTPLHCIYGKNTLSISDKTIPKCRRALSVMEKWISEGKKVFYITHQDRPLASRVDFEEIRAAAFRASSLEQPMRQLPRRRKKSNLQVKIFQVSRLNEKTIQEPGEYLIDIGPNCFGLMGGFGRPRRWEFTARWTYGIAEVIIPWPERQSEVTITIRMGGNRPPEEKPARVSFYIENLLIKEIEVSNEVKEYRLIVPASMAEPSFHHRAVLRLESTTWNPYRYGIKGYSSNLGVLLDWVKVAF